MVLQLDHVDIILCIYGDVERIVEMVLPSAGGKLWRVSGAVHLLGCRSITRAVTSVSRNAYAVVIEFLDRVGSVLGNIKVSILVGSYARWINQVVLSIPKQSDKSLEISIRIKHLNPMVVIIGHVNIVVLKTHADSNIEGQAELPRSVGWFPWSTRQVPTITPR